MIIEIELPNMVGLQRVFIFHLGDIAVSSCLCSFRQLDIIYCEFFSLTLFAETSRPSEGSVHLQPGPQES